MGQGPSMSPDNAYNKLMEGHQRWLENKLTHAGRVGPEARAGVTGGQAPFATVLTCADSRVPPEHIFDAGLGEVFVCRDAGNVIDDVILGSIEYAVAHTGCPLVVVLGHTSCGAMGATMAVAKDFSHYETHNVDDIIRRCLPAVAATKTADDGEWLNAAIAQNVENQCLGMLRKSPLIPEKVKAGEARVIGAIYDLATGKVNVTIPNAGL